MDHVENNLTRSLFQEVMKTLMLFSKDQGNYMFRKKLFPFAHELYYLGTIIAYDLRNKSVNDVDLEFVSVLFANLAFSKIKLVSNSYILYDKKKRGGVKN